MAETLNDKIVDAEVSHQIGVQQVASRLSITISSYLDSASRIFVKNLKNVEGSLTARRMDRLHSRLEQATRKIYVEMSDVIQSSLRELSEYEIEYQKKLLEKYLLNIKVSRSTENIGIILRSKPMLGRNLSVWTESLSRRAFQRLWDVVVIGSVEGASALDVARRIEGTRALQYRDGAADTSRRSAFSFVKTAVTHAVSTARETLFEANPNLIRNVQLRATLDARTSSHCAALDGRVLPVGHGPRPPVHWGCRLSVVPVLDGEPSEKLTYRSWFRRQSADIQDDILGATRGRLFRAGNLTIDRFVDNTGRYLTLDQLRVRDASAFQRAGL